MLHQFFANQDDSVLPELFHLADIRSEGTLSSDDVKYLFTLIFIQQISDIEVGVMMKEADPE
jgi:hypothetical protein